MSGSRPFWMCECDRVMEALARPRVDDGHHLHPTQVQPTHAVARGVVLTDYVWQTGRTLGVAFSGGSIGLRTKIEEIAREWPMNLDLDFSVPWAQAEIRIELFGEGSWAYIGESALLIEAHLPTMRLGWAEWAFQNQQDASLRAVVLHEFGHAIGLRHEHKHPLHEIAWNRAALRAYYVDALGWTWPQVEATYLKPFAAETHSFTPYDDESVMHYPVDERFTLDGVGVGYISELSRGDKYVALDKYPFPCKHEYEPADGESDTGGTGGTGDAGDAGQRVNLPIAFG